jgi:hypothetical protein
MLENNLTSLRARQRGGAGHRTGLVSARQTIHFADARVHLPAGPAGVEVCIPPTVPCSESLGTDLPEREACRSSSAAQKTSTKSVSESGLTSKG